LTVAMLIPVKNSRNRDAMVRLLKKSTAFVNDRLPSFLIFVVIIAAGSGSCFLIA